MYFALPSDTFFSAFLAKAFYENPLTNQFCNRLNEGIGLSRSFTVNSHTYDKNKKDFKAFFIYKQEQNRFTNKKADKQVKHK